MGIRERTLISVLHISKLRKDYEINLSDLRHLVQDRELYRVDLVRPFFDGDVACSMTTVFLLELQNLVDLVDAPLDCAVKKEN